MITKSTFATPGVWRPDVEGNTEKKLAGPCEVSVLKLIASAGAATVEIYDSASAADGTKLKWILDASTQDVDCQVFQNPLVFREGVYAKLVQGQNLNPFVCIARIH